MLNEKKLMTLVSNRYLELIILPTEQCNFRCSYCYEDFSVGKMKRNTVEAIKNLILRRIGGLDVIKISWFGGEPLVAKDIIFELSEFVFAQAQRYPSLKYVSGMTTNAFLLKEQTLKRLVHLGVTHYQISLDGTEEKHNQTRKRMDGLGSFQTIWKNLLCAKHTDLEFHILLRMHLTPDNLHNMHQLVNLIKANFGNDSRFSVFFKTIENLGGPNSSSIKSVPDNDKVKIIQQFYTYLGDALKVKNISSNEPYVCYAAQTNSFVIRANGKISKCTVAFNDSRNNIGELFDNGTLFIDSNKLALWTRGLKSQNESELHCPMSNMPNINATLRAIPIVIKK